MLVKAGDIVRIRSDLVVGRIYPTNSTYGNEAIMRKGMMDYVGQTVTVDFCGEGTYDLFLIKEDNHLHIWCTGMIEVLPYSELKSFLKGVSNEV